MKIAYLASKFPPIIGGGETQVYLLAKYMAKLGHDVTVVTDETVECLTTNFGVENFRIHYVPSFEKFCTKGNGFRDSCGDIYQELISKKYDIVHVHTQPVTDVFTVSF